MRSAGRNSTRVGVRIRISTQLRCAPKATASPKLEPRVLVEPGKWLVEHDHAAGVVYRPRQRHAALHAAGELGDGLVQVFGGRIWLSSSASCFSSTFPSHTSVTRHELMRNGMNEGR